MVYVILGSLGFVLVQLIDLATLRRVPGLKPLTWTAGASLIVAAAVMMALQNDRLDLPAWSSWLGWVLLLLSLPLLIYTLFINLPFRRTYIAGGEGRVVANGLYALVRHPWVYSLTLCLVALTLVLRSRLLVIATPIWVCLYVAGIAVRDRFCLAVVLSGYEEYRRNTPLLIPNRKSLSAFLTSIRQNVKEV